MKPQITIQDLSGVMNQNLTATRHRLGRAGMWKKQRVIQLVPAGDYIPAKAALAMFGNLIFPPNNGFIRMLAQGMEVGEAYSNAIADILKHPDLSKWEFLLTVEHDNCPPPDGLIRLIERMENNPHLAAVGGLYFTKGEGGVPQIWGDVNDPLPNYRPQLPDLNGGLVECRGLGMGFTLFRLKMFHDARLRRPWFVTKKDNEGAATQDLYAWADFRKHGYRCAVDCSVRVGHLEVERDIIW